MKDIVVTLDNPEPWDFEDGLWAYSVKEDGDVIQSGLASAEEHALRGISEAFEFIFGGRTWRDE